MSTAAFRFFEAVHESRFDANRVTIESPGELFRRKFQPSCATSKICDKEFLM
jgi:hypothetical protein